MEAESSNEGGKPAAPAVEKVGNPWLWALLRLAALALMSCSLGMPWLVEMRPQPGITSIVLLALPTLGLICLPYLAVYGLGLALAFLSGVLPARLRKVLSAGYMAALLLVILVGIVLLALGGVAQLDGTWGNWVLVLGAAMAVLVEILAWGKGRV